MKRLVLSYSNAKIRIAYLAAIGGAMTISSTLGSISENWEFHPANSEFTPFPYWWLVAAGILGAVIGGNLVYFACRHLKSSENGNNA